MRRENHAVQRTRALVFRDSLFVFLHEIQRRGVDAIAKTRRPWPVGENVAEMRITSAAEHFLGRQDLPPLGVCLANLFAHFRPPGEYLSIERKSDGMIH